MTGRHATGRSGSGTRIFVSAMDWHIYEASLSGGPTRRVTGGSGIDGLMHFLHGVSPDGQRLAFIGIELPGDGDNARLRATELRGSW